MADDLLETPAPSTKPSLLLLVRNVLPPSRPIATAVCAAFATEAFLIALGRPNLYRTDRSTIFFGLAFVFWFWTTVGWSMDRVGRRWRKQLSRPVRSLARCGLWAAMGLTGSTLALLYGVSWVLFLQTGRFANLETGRFLLFNFDQLIPYLTQAEPGQLALGLLVWAAAFVAWPCWLYWSVNGTMDAATPRRGGAILWAGLSVLTLLAWNRLPEEPSVVRQSIRQHALSHGLHPTFSLYVSHLEQQKAGQIPADLDTKTLEPLVSESPSDVAATADAPSVIFVAIESLRHDVIHQHHQGLEILPHINRLADRGLHWTKAYAQSTHSDYADVCLVSSLYPLRSRRHHYYGPSDPWPRTLIYDLLKPRGYATAIISSQNESWGGMAHFLRTPGLQHFYHPETGRGKTIVSAQDAGFAREIRLGGLVAGKFPDAHTTDVAIAWIEAQAKAKRPFFLSMNFQSSHFPYLMPDHVERPFQPANLDPHISFVNYPVEQTDVVRNAYYNAVHECDHQIGRLVAALERCRLLDNTIIVVTGENGEAFHECGVVTHAREPVEPVIHVACVMHAPRWIAPRVESYPLEHVDLVPTAMGLLGLPSHPNFQGIDALAENRPDARDRLTYCHVLSSLAEADSVMLGGRWKLMEDRRSGRTSLYDTQHDPLETRDLIHGEPQLAKSLQTALERWRERQLAYYHYPHYYLHFYPPQPPRWPDVSPVD